MVICCAACKSRQSKGNGISFHRFPTDPLLREKWVVATRRENYNPSIHSALCSKHFKKEDYIIHFGQRKIKTGVVPSIFEFPLHPPKKIKERKNRASSDYVEEIVLIVEPEYVLDAESELINGSNGSSVHCHSTQLDNVPVVIDVPRVPPIQVANSKKRCVHSIHTENDNVAMIATEDVKPPLQVENCRIRCVHVPQPEDYADRKRKRTQPTYLGDFDIEDMNCPVKAKLMFEIAKRTAEKKSEIIKCLRNKTKRLEKRFETIKTLLAHMKSTSIDE